MINKDEIFNEVNSIILENLEKGVFILPKILYNHFEFKNVITDRNYEGYVNKLFLYKAMMKNKYKYPFFMTFKNAKNNKFKIKKGSKGQHIIYANLYEKNLKPNSIEYKGLEKNYNKKNIPFEKRKYITQISTFNKFTVFNVDQIEYTQELEKLIAQNILDFKKIEEEKKFEEKNCDIFIKSFIKKNNIKFSEKIITSLSCGYFDTRTNEMVINKKDIFKNKNQYYSTLLHEIGHAEILYNKDKYNVFDFNNQHMNYAFEELIVEITSAHLFSIFNLHDKQLNNKYSSNYINHYLKLFKEEKNIMPKAQSIAKNLSNNLYTNFIENKIKLENKNKLKL